MSSTREAVLAAQDIKIEPVKVPEWGVEFHVKTLSGTARDLNAALIKGMAEAESDSQKMARFIVACACDVKGEAVFLAEDVERLAQKAHHVLARLFKAALAVNGAGPAAVENAAKNSESSPAE